MLCFVGQAVWICEYEENEPLTEDISWAVYCFFKFLKNSFFENRENNGCLKVGLVVECMVHYCGVVCLFVESYLINRR